MGIREKMVRRSEPFLEPGERVRHVFWSQTGGSPWLVAVPVLAFLFFRYRLVCVTDRAVVVMLSSRWQAKPKRVLARLPRRILFGPMSGVWGCTEATGEKLYVHKRFHKDVMAADAELQRMHVAGPPPAPAALLRRDAATGTAGATPAGWYPDPHSGAGQQRWFDGSRWTEHIHPG